MTVTKLTPERRRVMTEQDDEATPAAPAERLPSHNANIEAKLLGLLLYDSQLIPLVRERLTFPYGSRVRPFYRDAHQTLYDEMCTQYDAGHIPEYETIRDVLESTGRLERVGGDTVLWQYVIRSMEDPSLTNDALVRERVILQWAERLRDHALRRAAYDLGTTAGGIAYPDPKTAETPPLNDLLALRTRLDTLLDASMAGTSRYRFLSADELEALPDQEYLLQGVLPEDSISMIYGEPGAGKSFVTLDMALCIAAGIPWHGRPTKQGAVAYIAAEGGRGMKRRVRAWRAHFGVSDAIGFYVLPQAVPLMQPERVNELLAALRALPEPPALVVIDTLARSMDGGDENAAKDVNTVTAAADTIRQLHGAHVAIVHHSGKDGSRGARGSSALRGNVDTEIIVTKEENTVTVKCGKQKDDEPFTPLTLTLRSLCGYDGAPLSLVLIDAPNAPTPTPIRLKSTKQRALDALARFPSGVTASEWKQASGLAERTFYRYVEEFDKAGLIVKISDEDRPYYKLSAFGASLAATANTLS